jgi:hypothetical protein
MGFHCRYAEEGAGAVYTSREIFADDPGQVVAGRSIAEEFKREPLISPHR